MISIGPFSKTFLFVLVTIISKGNSTCPKDAESVCPTLPFNKSNPPDVWLNVPNLSVDKISLVVKDLKAHVSISAKVASLVSLGAGVDVSIEKVNLTIAGIKTQIQLAVHLDNIAKIITGTMTSLDLNPWLISIIDDVFERGNNLLGIFTQDGQLIHQTVNTVGKIVNQVLGSAGEVISSNVVGDYQQNMTLTGISRTLKNGNIIKQFRYSFPSDSLKSENVLINIVFDTPRNLLSTNVVNSASISTKSSTPISRVGK